MHFRRLICLLLGIWFGGTVVLSLETTHAHRAADQIMAEPAPGSLQYINGIGRDGARDLLRYAASEQSRWTREAWDSLQVLLGAAVSLLLLFGSREGKFGLAIAFAMLGLTLLERFVLTPEIISLGRVSDFIPPGTGGAGRSRYFMLEGGYLVLEGVKWTMGLALIASLMLRHARSAERGHVMKTRGSSAH